VGGGWGSGAFMPSIFTSSKGGRVVAGPGDFSFPDTDEWRGITSLSWTLDPRSVPDGYCLPPAVACGPGLRQWNTFSATVIDNFEFAVVPEPSLLLLGGVGVTAAWLRRRRTPA